MRALPLRFLLGIHPWNIRYASEARGYSLLVFLVPVLFVFWRRAMITGQWKWWGAFAVTEFSLIYCYPGAVFVLVVLNLITLALIATGRDCAEPRLHASRAVVLRERPCSDPDPSVDATVISAGKAVFRFRLVARLYIGVVMGSQYGLLHDRRGALDKSGEPWAGYPEWLARYVQNPLLFVVAASFAIALILLGAVHLLRRGWASATFVFVMSVCPPITFVFAISRSFCSTRTT